MPGNIAIVSNGAALAMATMDRLAVLGGESSGFVDIGGKTFHEQIQIVLDMFSNDPDTEVIFLNCYGGMQDGSVVSACLIDSIKRNVQNKHIVVRLKGLSAVSAN